MVVIGMVIWFSPEYTEALWAPGASVAITQMWDRVSRVTNLFKDLFIRNVFLAIRKTCLPSMLNLMWLDLI